MTQTDNTIAPFTISEKEGLANDLHMLANQLIEHGSYIFNLIAAINVQTDLLLRSKLVTESEMEDLIEKEIRKMKSEFTEQQEQQKAA